MHVETFASNAPSEASSLYRFAAGNEGSDLEYATVIVGDKGLADAEWNFTMEG